MHKCATLADIAKDPDALVSLDIADLRALWAQHFPQKPPSPHRGCLIRDLAWYAQAKFDGGLITRSFQLNPTLILGRQALPVTDGFWAKFHNRELATTLIVLSKSTLTIQRTAGQVAKPMNKTTALIMLVEDESAIASTIIYALEREHFQVKHFLTGIEAEQYWKSAPAELAILDVGLPDQSGFELCKKLKSSHPERPIMFLTAQHDEIDRIVGLELGADDYVCKPFSPRELVLRVKTILRRHASSNNPPETSRNFKHDREKKQITFKNKKLTLTKSEYLLLSTMMKHPGRVFTRDNLLDALNDTSEQSSDRAIDTHIKELRGKLRIIDPGCEIIVTHRGLGYSLDESE